MELYREHSPYEEETKQRTQRRDENKKKKKQIRRLWESGKANQIYSFLLQMWLFAILSSTSH